MHWSANNILQLIHNPCIARYFSYCRFALKLEEMLHVSKFYIPLGQKTLHTPPLAQVRERKPWALLHVMPFSRLRIHWEVSCKKKTEFAPYRLTASLCLINLSYVRGHIPFSTVGCRGPCQEICCFNILNQNLLMQQVTRSVIQCSEKSG